MNTYQYRICKESLLSRIPGLFPYITYNSLGEAELHKATDSIVGCYAKIIQDMILPSGVSLIIDGETLLESGICYSYRTLIDYYYRYLENLSDDDSFKLFIETAIGKVKVTDQSWYDPEAHDLVPEYMYLALAKTQYNWFTRRKLLCERYNEMKEDGTHEDCAADYCCKCDEYERRGGDNMLALLKELMDDANNVANEYYGYASEEITDTTLDIHVLITTRIKDSGVMTPLEIDWIAGDEYKRGDIVIYDDESYVCTLDEGESTTGKYNEITEKIEFDPDSFTKIKDLCSYGTDDSETCADDGIVDSVNKYGTRFGIVDRKYYVDGDEVNDWKRNTGYDIGDNVVYRNTVYTCNSSHMGGYVFDSSYFDECDTYDLEYADKTDEDIEVSGVTSSKLKSFRRFRDYINEYDEFETPGFGEDWLFYYRIGLSSYRTSNDELGNISFIFEADEWESGMTYTTGKLLWHDGTLYECVTRADGDGYFDYAKYEKAYMYLTSDGNTVTEYDGDDEDMENVSDSNKCYNLYAYGDVLTDIRYEYDSEDRYKIIFEYVIGAHLKATYMGYDVDDDGNYLFKFSNFEYDETDLYHGVRQTDVYYVSTDSDIYHYLIAPEVSDSDSQSVDSDTTFTEYVSDTESVDTMKYEFSTAMCTVTEEKYVNNKRVRFPTIVSEFSATVKNELDYSYSKMIKTDYLTGISYSPSTDVDVNITRGNASAFDRHIKLGEIKTMEDLENYSNGGFYNIQENS